MQLQGKRMIQTQKNSKKPHFGLKGPNQGNQIFYSKIWLCQSLEIIVSYHHVKYQKKTNGPIFRKFSDGRMDRQMDRQRRVIS